MLSPRHEAFLGFVSAPAAVAGAGAATLGPHVRLVAVVQLLQHLAHPVAHLVRLARDRERCENRKEGNALMTHSMREREREREMFYLMMHAMHLIYGYMVSDIGLRTILIVTKETHYCLYMGYSFQLINWFIISIQNKDRKRWQDILDIGPHICIGKWYFKTIFNVLNLHKKFKKKRKSYLLFYIDAFD